jgi:hypothetical protein
MPLDVFAMTNAIVGPRSVLIDRTAFGYHGDDGININPDWETEPFSADNQYGRTGFHLTDVVGTLGMQALECPESVFGLLMGLNAGTDITAPLAGVDFDARPSILMPNRLIEVWGLWGTGVLQSIFKGCLTKPPARKEGKKGKTILDLSYQLVQFSPGYPAGFYRMLDAVDGAVTLTSSPEDAATNVAAAVTPTITFNKPMSSLALMSTHWRFTKDADASAVAFTPAFGTLTKDGVTITDPTKIVLTPASALTAGAAYTLLVYQGIPAVDGTTLAANSEINFTVAS